jgi:hypothetical protein
MTIFQIHAPFFRNWRIRTKPAPYSGASQHPIPLEASTLFRTKPAGDSGASQQVFVI